MRSSIYLLLCIFVYSAFGLKALPDNDAKQFIFHYGNYTKKLYAIHRTQFRKDRNYFTVAEVSVESPYQSLLGNEFSNGSNDIKYFETRLADFSTLTEGTEWKGSIYIGSSCFVGGVKMKIEKILLHKTVDRNGKKPGNTQFLEFGPAEYYNYDDFIVHEITSPPDYMQIWSAYSSNAFNHSAAYPKNRLTFPGITTFLPYEGANPAYYYRTYLEGQSTVNVLYMNEHLYFEQLKDEF